MTSRLLLSGFLFLVPFTNWAAADTRDFSALDSYIEEQIVTRPTLGGGAALILVDANGVIHRRGYGTWADDPGQVRIIRSATKWLSGALVMNLVEDGVFRLEDRVGDWLPEWDDVAKGFPTIEQCFSHTSGMRPKDGTIIEDPYLTLTEAVDRLLAVPRNEFYTRVPGAVVNYGGNSMQVVGRIAEVATGNTPWSELFAQRIAGPLEMSQTLYNAHDPEWFPQPTKNPHIGGGITTTIDDLANFLQMILNDGRFRGRTILRPETIDRMLADATGEAEILATPWTSWPQVYNKLDPDYPTIRCGIGVWRETVLQGQLVEASSAGGNGSYFWVDFENQIGGAFLIDSSPPVAIPVIYAAKHLIRREYQPYRLSPLGRSYADPEFLQSEGLVAYQTEADEVYLAKLDPVSGEFIHPLGQDYALAIEAAPVGETFNGPEFGVDSNGWAVFFTSKASGAEQIHRATIVDSEPVVDVLTSGTPHQAAMPQRDPSAGSTHLLCIRGPVRDEGNGYLFNEEDPDGGDVLFPFERGFNNPFWTTGTDQFLTSVEVDGTWQAARYDVSDGSLEVLTDDLGDKTWCSEWVAPDFGGEKLLLAVLDDSAIAVYADRGGTFSDRMATLRVPDHQSFYQYGSPEPFVANNKSYISLMVKYDTPSARVGEIWIFDVNDNPATRFARRVDDGAPNVDRSDPEVFVGAAEAFVYYNARSLAGYALYRVPTGIRSYDLEIRSIAIDPWRDTVELSWISDPRLTYRIEASGTAYVDSFEGLPGLDSVPGENGETSHVFDDPEVGTAQRRFYRVEENLPY